MKNIPLMSLKAAPIQFATFTPVQYTTKTSDPTLLAKSMAAQEKREEEANQYMNAIVATLADKRQALNKADYEYLVDKTNNMKSQIDKQLELGNWQTAIRLSRQFARDIAGDKGLQDRIDANKIYTTERNKIQSGNYNPYTKRRWDDINKYKFNGTADWTPTFNPKDDMSFTDIMNLAVSKTPIRSNSSSSSKTRNNNVFYDNKGNLVKDVTEQYIDNQGNSNTRIANGVIGTFSTTSTTKQGSKSVQERNASDIMAVFNDMLKDDNIRGALRQQYDNMIWLYDKSKSILADKNATDEERKQAEVDLDIAENSLKDKDGFLYADNDKNFDAWINAQASQYFKDSSYKHISTTSTDNITTSYSDSALQTTAENRALEAINNYSPSFSTVQGPNIEYTATPGVGGYNAGSVMDLINTSWNNKMSKQQSSSAFGN